MKLVIIERTERSRIKFNWGLNWGEKYELRAKLTKLASQGPKWKSWQSLETQLIQSRI